MSTTSIEWTVTTHADGSVTPGRVWNPVTGCTKVSQGCKFCYAEEIAKRFWATQYRPVLADGSGKSLDTISTSHHGDYLANGLARSRRFTDVLTHPDRLLEPLSWRKPARVFVNSMSDLFHEDVPDAFIDRVFAVMALADRHTFQILTKRPERMRAYLSDENWAERVELQLWELHTDDTTNALPLGPVKNVWLGVSVENQETANERIPLLLQTPAAVRFISAEPLLGPVDLWARGWLVDGPEGPPIDWVIVGGESGPGARMFNLEWARAIVEQCKAASVAVFVKQLGVVPVLPDAVWRAQERVPLLSAANHRKVGKEWAPLKLHDRKGGAMSEWPEDLRVRQFPDSLTGSTRPTP